MLSYLGNSLTRCDQNEIVASEKLNEADYAISTVYTCCDRRIASFKIEEKVFERFGIICVSVFLNDV